MQPSSQQKAAATSNIIGLLVMLMFLVKASVTVLLRRSTGGLDLIGTQLLVLFVIACMVLFAWPNLIDRVRLRWLLGLGSAYLVAMVVRSLDGNRTMVEALGWIPTQPYFDTWAAVLAFSICRLKPFF